MITSKQELFTALRRKGDEIKISSISSDLLKDKDVIRGIASNYAPLIKEIPDDLIDNETARLIIEKSINNFEHLPIIYKQDKDFISQMPLHTIENLSILKFCSSEILSDKDFILKLLDRIQIDDVSHFRPFSITREIAKECLYPYLNEILRKDIEVIKRFSKFLQIFEFTPIELRNDIDFSEKYISEYPENIEFAGSNIKSNRELIKSILSKRGDLIAFVKDIFSNDLELATLAVKSNGLSLEHFSQEIQNNLEIVKLAILENPSSLKFASDNLKNNTDLIIAAIDKDGFALEFASEKLRDNELIVNKAISHKRTEDFGWGSMPKKSSGGSFKFASERIKNIKNLALIALNNEGMYGPQNSWGNFDHESEKPLFEYLPEILKNDKEIVTVAIENNLECVRYIDPSIRDSPEIKTLIRTKKEQEKNDEKPNSDGWGNSTDGWK
jgi:hypothetical protein